MLKLKISAYKKPTDLKVGSKLNTFLSPEHLFLLSTSFPYAPKRKIVFLNKQ